MVSNDLRSLIDELKPYPVYKDSGVPWLGEVPARWDVRRLRLNLLTDVSTEGLVGR